MDSKKFWIIVYLHIARYKYNIIHFNQEKNDIWLINKKNELLRFVYKENIKNIDIDHSISNVIKNKLMLKKLFSLSSLKLKVLFVSNEYDDSIIRYKKYKVAEDLVIERDIFTEDNKQLYIKKSDEIIFNNTSTHSRDYKEKILNIYKKEQNKKRVFDYTFSFLSIGYIFLFLFNYIMLYLSNNKYDIYSLIDYNYQKIISGDFYRLFSNIFVINDIKFLIYFCLFIFLLAFLFNDSLKIKNVVFIAISTSFLFNLAQLLNNLDNINIVSLALFSVIGSIFIIQISKKDSNNFKLLLSIAISILYLLTLYLFIGIYIPFYVIAFSLGVGIELLISKQYVRKFILIVSLLVVTVGFMITITNFGLKERVNKYRLDKIYLNIVDINQASSREKNVEKELNSKNKSILTYYELGMLKMVTSSVEDSKTVFLEGLKFDDKFAPIYYELAVIELASGNVDKSSNYIEKALNLDKNNEKYKNLQATIKK